MKIVRIAWFDVQFLELRGLSCSADLEGLEPQKCVIVGHLVKETAEAYFVAKELWESGVFKYVHCVPKRMVESFEVLC